MSAAEQPASIDRERTELTAELTAGWGAETLTTRAEVTAEVARAWLDRHREVTVTPNDLSKTLQELVTELFATEAGGELSEHAIGVLHTAGVDAHAFASARTLPKHGDMTASHGLLIARVCVVLAPLASAVRMARVPVTDAAVAKLQLAASERAQARRGLRDLVVARVKPFAYSIHDVVGNDETACEYLRLILTGIDALAEQVVAAAAGRDTRAQALDAARSDQLADCMRTHGSLLRGAAARRYGADADEILGDVGVKLSVAFRNNAALEIGEGFVLVALRNTAQSYYLKVNRRRAYETQLPDDVDVLGSGRDEAARLEVVDQIVRHVLAAASTLDTSDDEAQLARQALLEGFLADPAEVDPRKARLADHALGMVGADDGLRNGLKAVAARLTTNKAAAGRIARRAIAALRSWTGLDAA